MKHILKDLKALERKGVNLGIGGKTQYIKGGTRFGGVPDVPVNFEWPRFECSDYDDNFGLRPLDFLLQINLEEIAPLDGDNLLPKRGLLSFFHVTEAACFGFSPEDMGCVKVYYFEDISALSAAVVPEELKEKLFPMLKIDAEGVQNFPDFEDFSTIYGLDYDEYDDYEAAIEELTGEEPGDDTVSKLLGWADVIQSNMTTDLELISRGNRLENSADYKKISKSEREKIDKTSPIDWVLLLQLDTVDDDVFELMYGDCGCLYVYIRREDLLARRFDKVCFSIQCF